jgi:hypothetical protein
VVRLSRAPTRVPPPRPNTELKFNLVGESRLHDMPQVTKLDAAAWETALRWYPDARLREALPRILTNGVQLGYTGPETLIISDNLRSVMTDPAAITKQLDIDLATGRVSNTTGSYPFISSPLGQVPKSDGGLRRIHYLSFSENHSVDDHIL